MTENGWFYFGKHSIPIKCNEEMYQIKCLYRWTRHSKKFETVILEFNLKELEIDKTDLDAIKTDYIKVANLNYIFTGKNNLYHVTSFESPNIVQQSKYNEATIMNKIFSRLQKMAIQKKPI